MSNAYSLQGREWKAVESHGDCIAVLADGGYYFLDRV